MVWDESVENQWFRVSLRFSRAFLTHAGPSDAERRTVRRVRRAPRAFVFGSILIVWCIVFCSRRTVRHVQLPFDHVCGAFCLYCPTLHRTVRRSTPDSPTLIAGPSDACCCCGSALRVPRSLLSVVTPDRPTLIVGPSDALDWTVRCVQFRSV